MDLEELYKKKGELVTKIELYEMELQKVNKEILKQLNLISSMSKEETINKE